MASSLHGLKIETEKMQEWHSVTDKWHTMQSPTPVLTVTVLYLIFVLKIGPNYMIKRPAFELKRLLVVYNFLQVALSVYLVYKTLDLVGIAVSNLFAPGCRSPVSNFNEHQRDVAVFAWWYTFAKLTELLDTVFFVLRKKSSQVTFLHVYHHAIMFGGSWIYLKYTPGEPGAVLGCLNSIVHVVMYTYYGIAALGPKYTKYIWWKKYMTAMQLIQFLLMLSYLFTLSLSPSCQFHRAYTYFIAVNVVLFIYLFGNFYRKSYSKKLKSGSIDKHMSEEVKLQNGHNHAFEKDTADQSPDYIYMDNYLKKNGRTSMISTIKQDESLSCLRNRTNCNGVNEHNICS